MESMRQHFKSFDTEAMSAYSEISGTSLEILAPTSEILFLYVNVCIL
jgi:hypothetical protein